MTRKEEAFNPRTYMELAIKVMNQSIQEPRSDKTSPKVGAVLLKPNGVVETAFRGELRHGDHAEFTLLERKNRSIPLDGSVLFATLEPCAPGSRRHPKLGCAERIVNARIRKVWIGIEDPDPSVDRKGIQYLIDNGIQVEMFDADLQSRIRDANKIFIEEAEERAKKVKKEKPEMVLSQKEKAERKADIDDLSKEEINRFIQKAKLDVAFGSKQFYKVFSQLGLIDEKEGINVPTGLGLLLFGSRPQLIFPNALIRATYKTAGRGEEIITIDGPLTLQPDKIQNWYETKIGSQVDRYGAHRKIIYDFPLDVFREAIINAIVHRDYDIEGAPIYFEINDDSITIKSPGQPVSPLLFEQIKTFTAPSLCRNPKIMYIFDQLELVEQRGLGFQTIKELPIKYNIPLPLVTWDAPYLVMTFPRSSDALKRIDTTPGLMELNDEELVGFEFVKFKGKISKKDYALHFNYDDKKALRHLSKMRNLGLIRDNGESIKSNNYRYIFNDN